MASTTQDEFYRDFLTVSGQQTSVASDVNTKLADVVAQLQTSLGTISKDPAVTGQVSTTALGQQPSLADDPNAMLADVIGQLRDLRGEVPTSTTAVVKQSSPQVTSNDSGSVAGSVASTVLKSGFGLAPLIGGLVSLFSGGDSEAPAPLVKYAMPAAIDFQAAESNSRLTGLEYDQSGLPRTFADAANRGGTNGSVPQVTVNVQAMDARSFMDRSNEIALAVRDAMLNSNAINDVVNEL